jgi:DnaJ-class molecular chaperone
LPYHEIFDDSGKLLHGSWFGYAYGGILNKDKHSKTINNVRIVLECTLEELYIGCVRQVEFENQSRTVEIKPGYKDGHQIILKSGGSQPESSATVVIKQIPHPKYERKGDDLRQSSIFPDLLYKHDISLVDALNSSSCKFRTLDGRTLNISVDEIISPQTVRVVEGEGMPIYDPEEEQDGVTWAKKGKMFMVFNIKFPKNMTEDKKAKIVHVLNTPSIESES